MLNTRRNRGRRYVLGAVIAVIALVAASCGDDEENTGRSCEVVDDCYPGLDQSQLLGAVECLDRVPGGYCTHACTADTDCCAVTGECETDIPQLCAPYENSTDMRCFLSCDAATVGTQDENDYCHEHANETFLCRSTGGGAENRKVCVPE